MFSYSQRERNSVGRSESSGSSREYNIIVPQHFVLVLNTTLSTSVPLGVLIGQEEVVAIHVVIILVWIVFLLVQIPGSVLWFFWLVFRCSSMWRRRGRYHNVWIDTIVALKSMAPNFGHIVTHSTSLIS